ncbi:uncharacterized protein LOC133293691 [Gastrolobium bilobum]|uniref:uncharacterized protein LOC133293691 n=1 Tax=Gastrolobium bilobum TaxID=150636 RepID=UPI002AB08A40|nr:uncharacterized protein LOC133293691 [Gastrolobium bilobum]
MASKWVKSLQCKSRAFEDVYHPNPKILMPSVSCRKSVQNIKDMVDIPKPKPRKPKPKPALEKQPSSKYPTTATTTTTTTKSEFEPTMKTSRRSSSTNTSSRSITELPVGHPSRNVVEIIFHTSWGPKPFPGRVEIIFKVQNGTRTVSRFEEFREAVKGRAAASVALAEGTNWEENARCVADGNEVMRFHCLGPAADGGPYDGGFAWSFPERKGSAICTFAGSGGAHETAGGGRGRRAMLVCRVIAGRVSKQLGFLDSLLDKRVGFDSVSGDNGELLVFDSRAVLPCFLIIYEL